MFFCEAVSPAICLSVWIERTIESKETLQIIWLVEEKNIFWTKMILVAGKMNNVHLRMITLLNEFTVVLDTVTHWGWSAPSD